MDTHGIAHRVRAALDALDAPAAPARDRLLNAIRIVVPLRAEDFPAAAQEEFRSAMESATRVPSDAAGSLQATLKAMSDEEVAAMAQRVRSFAEWALALVCGPVSATEPKGP